MRMAKLLMAVSLAVLAVTLVLLISREREHQAMAMDEHPARLAQEMTHTVHLPLVTRYYDPSYVSPFGIVMYGNVDDSAGLQVMENAGSKWVTTMFSWSAVEPTRDIYNWSGFDSKVQNARAAGMDIFVLFSNNPSWAAVHPHGPVTDTQDLVEIARLMAERYDCDGMDDAPGSPCVHYWSLYAEPDVNTRWGNIGDKFAAMLYQVSSAIHQANPQAKVLIGGLAYDWFEDDPNPGPFVRSFLSDTLQALNALYPGGAKAYIDAVAFHFYPISTYRWPTIREKALEIRGIMERHGVGDLPLICPEMGYWSSPKWYSSEQAQAARLVQMYVRGLSVGIQHLSWYKVFDDVEPGTAADDNAAKTSGLLRVDGTLKPSYYAYQTLTQELAWARYLRPLQTANAEGYVFRMPDGHEKTVLWATATSTSVSFPYSCLRLVDTTGTVYYPVLDGDSNWDWDHQKNGQIALGVFQNTPFYVEPCH